MFARHCPPPGATALRLRSGQAWRPYGQSGIASIVVFLLLPTTAFASVVISELLWAGSDLSTADEWIELTNTAGTVPGGTVPEGAVDVGGWTLTKQSDGEEVDMLTLPPGASIGPGQTFLISNYDEEHSRLNIEPDIVDTFVALSNTQLLIRLYRPEGTGRTLIDAADDGVGAPFAGSNDPPKASMERIDLMLRQGSAQAGSGQVKDNWRTATTFMNFDDGAPLFGTPKAPNGTGASVDTFAPKEATGLNAEVRGSGSGSELVVSWTPSTSLDLTTQTLSFNGNESAFDATATGTTIAGIGTGVTFTLRSTDASGNTSSGVSTVSTLFPNVRITEVLANPAGADDEEWIEIGNLGPEALDIGGWILDEENSPGHYVLPSPTILQPNEHMALRKTITGLPLDNKGEQLSLTRGLTVMHSWAYRETAEEVSYGLRAVPTGRQDDAPDTFQPFCVPTPGKPNIAVLPDPRIVVQSTSGETQVMADGTLWGVNKITVNLVAEVLTGSTVHALCRFDYGDGFVSDSCNPPSHTFKTAGAHRIRLTYTDFCGNTVEREMTATVGEQGHYQSDDSCPSVDVSGVSINEFIPDPVGKDDAPFAPSVHPSTEARELAPASEGRFDRAHRREGCPERVPRMRDESNGHSSLGSSGSSAAACSRVLDGTGGALAGRGEWIELLNASKKNAPLCGFALDDAEGGSKPFALDAKEIPPFGFLVLTREETKIALNNEGDTVRLFSPKGALIEEVPYGGSTEGESYAKAASGTFLWTSIPTPGEDNVISCVGAPRCGAQGVKSGETAEPEEDVEHVAEQQQYALTVVFSEIMPNPPKEGPLHDLGEYIELMNLTGTGISLAGWILDDNPDGSSKPHTFPEGTAVPVQGYILLCDGSGCDLPLKVSLNNEGEELSLTSPDGSVFSTVTYPKMDRGEAYAVYADEWHRTLVPTPGQRNTVRDAHAARRGATVWRPAETVVLGMLEETVGTVGRHTVAPLPPLRTRYRHMYPQPKPDPQPEPDPNPLLAALLPQITDLTLPPTLATTGSPAETTKKAVFVLLAFLSLSMTVFTRQKVARPL